MTETMIRDSNADMKVTTMLLLPEALARSRMSEAQRVAREYRMSRSVTAGRAWSRLARYAQRRAEQARR